MSCMSDLHQWATELLDQDRLALQDLRPLASSMMELRSSFTFGAYVRVKTGAHSETKDFPQLVSVFTRYIRRQFPDAPFLTFRLQMNEGTSPAQRCTEYVLAFARVQSVARGPGRNVGGR